MPKEAVPAIDTVLAETANWCLTVMGGVLSFSARQDYETTTHNNRSRGIDLVWGGHPRLFRDGSRGL